MPLEDTKEFVRYFRFEPEGYQSQSGVLSTPLMGETEAGRIYPVHTPSTADVLASHNEWKEVREREYNSQAQADRKEQLA